MVSPHLPIDIMRMVSLNRLRKSRRLAKMSSNDQLRSIRRRAAGAEEPSSDSNVRMEQIARIRAAIAEGRYHVSAADLAQKLIDHMVATRLPKL
jgi:flagellar biosynthesis anti-sigma factor FlgM